MVKYRPVQIIQGGFSEPILQPCYLVGIGTIFLLNPFLGLFLSTLIVAIPAFYIGVKIAKKQEEQDALIKNIVWTKMNLPINIDDLRSLLKIHKCNITPELLKQKLEISYKEATKLTEELIASGLATDMVQTPLTKQNDYIQHAKTRKLILIAKP